MQSSSDTLEVVLNFNLPEGSLVTDSWLWIGDEIVKADIIDKWTARTIYEGIVQRRQDPSILSKTGNEYELRIFPLVGNSTRKVKMSVMLLNSWGQDGSFTTLLPLEMLKASQNQYCYNNGYYDYGCGQNGIPSATKILLKQSDFSTLKSINSVSGATYSALPVLDSTHADVKGFVIGQQEYSNSFGLTYSSKLKNGIFLNTYPTGPQEGYYQLMFLPSQASPTALKRKTLFLVDYENSKSSITSQDLYATLKKYIESNYAAQDSFAILFSGFTITGTGSRWNGGDSLSKAAAFKSLSASQIKGYSNLTAVLAEGAKFVQEKGGGDIVMISASEHNFNPSNSNQLINDYVAALPPKTRFSAVDLATNINYSTFSSGIYYYGDGYFYSNLCRLTKGYWASLYESYSDRSVQKYAELLSNADNANVGILSSFEIYTKLLNGFCSGRQNVMPSTQQQTLYTPFIQVGKYNGTLPFIIETSGIFEGKAFFKNFSVEANELSKPDSATKTIWEGRYVLDREKLVQTNAVIGDIVEHSIRNRVLSNYTAFLALEPSRGGQICSTCVADDNEQVATGLEDELLSKDSLLVTVFPTPASKNAQIVIKDYMVSNGSKVSIFNSMGELTRELSLETASIGRGKVTMNIDLEEIDLRNGAYFVIYSNGERTKKGKMIVQR